MPYPSSTFREFDEDDLDSYLEDNIWSEKHHYTKPSTSDVITVFPCSSSFSARAPSKTCETIFIVKRPLHSPRCTRHNVIRPCVVSRPGSPGPVAGAGDITNTKHGFTIELDVKHFHPEEIKVVLTKDLLCISGEQTEISNEGHSLRRSFARNYSIPPDVILDSIRSHLGDDGVLIVNGSRRGWKETNLYVHAAPEPGARRAGSIISTV